MKRCVIFGGGQIGDPEQIKNLVRQEDYLICADSGYRHCVQLGFSPQLVLGDFDSYAGVVQSDCELLRYPIEKDDTDTMLAVKQALQRGYERLVLVGMLGGRLDHTLANIQTLVYAVEHGAAAQIIDSSCYISREDRQRRFHISRDFTFRYSATATVQAECASAMQSMSWRQRSSPTVFPSGSAIPFWRDSPHRFRSNRESL